MVAIAEDHAQEPAGKVDPGVAVGAALAVDRVSNDVVRHVVEVPPHGPG